MARPTDFLRDFAPLRNEKICSRLTLKERGCEYRLVLQAPAWCLAYNVDGGIVTDKSLAKCDRVVYICNSGGEAEKSVFVELKGRNVEHAIEQLASTLEQQIFKLNRARKIFARAVTNRCPANAGNASTEKAKKKFRQSYNCELKILKPGNPDKL